MEISELLEHWRMPQGIPGIDSKPGLMSMIRVNKI